MLETNTNCGATLPQLLAIDKTFTKLKDQLAEARRLLHVPSRVTTNNFGRHELLVKWLLERLRTSSAVRATPQAWELLQDIVSRLPWRTSIDIEEAILLSLSENFPEALLFEDLQAFKLVDGEHSSNSGSKEPRQLAGHKRKRSEVEPAKPRSDDRSALFAQLLRVFQSFQDRARSVEGRTTSRYRPDKWLACTKSESCTTFIKHWAIATIHVLKLDHHIVSYVSAIDQFWQMQDLYLGSSAELFATECLPALSLLLALSTQSDKRHLIDATHVGILERMIDQTVLRTARMSCRKAKDLDSSAISLGKLSVQQLSQAVTSLYEKEHGTDHKASVQASWPWSFRVLSTLFDLALRRTPLSSVAQRRHEKKWVDELCLALLPPSGSNVAPFHEVFAALTAARLLAMAKSCQLVLSRHVLDVIIQQFSAMSAEAFDSVHLDLPRTPLEALAAQLLDMDASLFTDADSPYIQFLLRGMTSEGLMARDNPSAISSYWCDRLAIPLLRDFARTRRLDPYLQHWRESLEMLSWDLPGDRSDGEGSGQRCMSVWTDKSLRDALVDVFEPSLTLQQIEQIITGLLDSLDVLVANQDDESVRKAASNVVLLHAATGAITTDSIIDKLQPVLTRLITTINENFSQMLEWSVDDELATYLWSLLCRAHRRCWQLTTNANLVGSALHGQSVLAAWTRISKASKHTAREMQAMLEYVLLVCDLNARNPESRDDVRLFVLRLWTDAKTWENLKRVSEDEAPDAKAGKQKKSVAAKQPLALATALLATSNIWTFVTSDMLKFLLESLKDGSRGSNSIESTEAIASGVTSAWSERNGMAKDTRGLFSPPTNSSENMEHIDKSGWQQLESHLARSALGKRHGKLADDVLTMWAIASRADTLSAAEGNADDRDCYSLFIRQCQTLFTTRKALKNATPWLEEYERKLHSSLKSEGLSEHGYRMVMWILLKRACNGNGPIDSDVVKLVEKLPGHNVDFGGIPFSTYRAFACLPVEYWSMDGVEPSSRHRQPREVARSIVERFIDEARATDDTDLRIERLDGDTVAALFERYSHSASHEQVVSAAVSLLNRSLDPRASAALLDMLSSILGRLDQGSLKKVIDQLLASVAGESVNNHVGAQKLQTGRSPAVYVLLKLALQCLERPIAEDDEDDNRLSFPRLLESWPTCTDSLELVELTSCVTHILREKDFLVNQFSMEMLLANLQRSVSPSSPISTDSNTRPACPSAIFMSLCSVMQALLQSHRRSLGGRAHLLIPLLTQMLACFFTLHADSDARAIRHPPWLTSALTVAHAQRFARLLTLLCDPPQASIVRRRRRAGADTGLVDQVRKSRIEISHHVHNLLHGYVRFQLHGRLADGVKEALEPGVSAVIQVLDLDSAVRKGAGRATDGRVRALGACMGKSELALLRREWETWRAVHGTWKG